MSQSMSSLRPVRTQNMTVNATSATTPLPVGAGVCRVRLASTQDCYITIGPAAAVTAATGMLLRASTSGEIFGAWPGDYVNALQVAAAGILSVSDMSS